MKLTPLDIHHKEFRTSLRGYSEKEVDAFLDEVADEFDRLFKENVDLNERIQATLERIKSYEDMKDTLQNTLIVAQQHAESVESDASKRSDLLMREADLKAQQIVADALAEKQRVQQDVMKIRRAAEEYRAVLAQMIERHLREATEVAVPDDFPTDEDIEATRGEVFEAVGGVKPVAPAPAAPAPVAPTAPSYADAVAAAEVTEPASVPPVAPVLPLEEPEPWPAAAVPAAPVPRSVPAPIPPIAASDPTTVMPAAPVAPPAPIGGVQPPAGASSLTLGEVEAPAVGSETGVPVFTDPAEFQLPTFGSGFGQVDDGVDIEEID